MNIGDRAFFDDFGLVLGALKSRSALFPKGDDLGGAALGVGAPAAPEMPTERMATQNMSDTKRF